MAPKNISMRGLAEVASAKPSRKYSKLKQYRFPESEESKGRSNYYVKALSAIKRYHRGQSGFVNSVLKSLVVGAASETDPRKRAKLLNNHRAITDYLKAFGSRPLVMMPGKKLHYVYKDLVVSAHPDLVAEENGSLVLIKLNLGKDDFAGGCEFNAASCLVRGGVNAGPSNRVDGRGMSADLQWFQDHRPETRLPRESGVGRGLPGTPGLMARCLTQSVEATRRRSRSIPPTFCVHFLAACRGRM
jgi:hypothetical protein